LLGDVGARTARVGSAETSPDDRPLAGTAALRRHLLLIVAALLVAPFVIGAIRMVFAIGGSYEPWADHAAIELNIRDIGHHAVLVGLFSRYVWFHPGPLLFYVLLIPYRLLGSMSVGMQVGALAINAASVAGCLVVARRRGGTPAMLCTAVALGLFMRSTGADTLRDPWPPYVAVLPLALVLLLSWSVADGRAWALPWAVGVASFVVQTHIGFAPVALSLVVWGLVVSCVRTFRSRRRPEVSAPLLRPLLASLATGFVLWIPPLYAQLFTSDHNLSKIYHYFTTAHGAAGWSRGWRVVEYQLSRRPEWLFGVRNSFLSGFAPSAQGAAVPWLLVLGAGALAVAIVLRHRTLGMLLATLVVATATAVYAVSSITGGVFAYLVRWTWVIGACWGIAILWAAWLAVSELLLPRLAGRVPRPRLAPATSAGVALLAVLALATTASVSAVVSAGPQASHQHIIRSASAQVRAHLPPGSGPVAFVGSFGGLEESAIALQLERHGVKIFFSDFNGDNLRTRRPHGVVRVLVSVVSGPASVDAATPPGATRIARAVVPYSRAELARARAVVRSAEARFGPQSRFAAAARNQLRTIETHPKDALVVFAQRVR